jgi:hypothetical protein
VSGEEGELQDTKIPPSLAFTGWLIGLRGAPRVDAETN